MDWHWFYIFPIWFVVVHVWAIIATWGKPIDKELEQMWQDNM